jgi:DNA polymerase elongation subunit (family B)
MVNYENLQKHIVEFLKSNHLWHRAVSIDIEADLRTLDDPKKVILSISTARRVNNRIDIKNFIVNEESLEEEIRIFNEFGSFCEEVRPLVLVGFGNSRFDVPLLLLKMRRLDNLFKQNGLYQSGYWAFRDTLTRSYILDVINPVRFAIADYDNTSPKFVSLDFALKHPRFRHLPFKNSKGIVSNLNGDKWEIIRGLWKNDRKKFEQYIEGDVHDTLLLAEDIFKINGE